jgi:hypothetical protein
MRNSRTAYKFLVEKLEGKRPVRKPKHRWEDNIEMDLKKQDGKV